MINPIYIIVSLCFGMLFGLFIKKSHYLSIFLLLLIFLFTGIAPFLTFWKIYFHHVTPPTTTFVGVDIPLIVMNANRAVLISLINLFGLFSGLYLIRFLKKQSVIRFVSFLLFFLSINLMVLTNSFNVLLPSFVAAVFSYFSVFHSLMEHREKRNYLYELLVVIILLTVGTLGIILQAGSGDYSSIGAESVSGIYVFLLFFGFIILFNLFPLLTWVTGGMSKEKSIYCLLYQILFLTAAFYVFFILSGLYNSLQLNNIFAILGILTYFFASFLATGQKSLSKVLGYSTSAQYGLMIAVIGLGRYLGMDSMFILITLLLTHFLSKTGLLMIANSFPQDNISKWYKLKRNPVILFLFGIFIFALIGIPPFPSFYARWLFIQHLVDYQMYDWLICFALAFLFESYYVYRWLSSISKKDKSSDYYTASGFDVFTGIFTFVLMILASVFAFFYVDSAVDLQYDLLLFVFLIYLLSFTPPAFQLYSSVCIISTIFLFNHLIDSFPSPQAIVILIVALLTLITLIINFKKNRYHTSLYAIVLLIYSSLVALTTSHYWSSLLVWSLLLVVGLYLYLINKDKVKKHALFFLLIFIIAISIMWVGLISGISISTTPKISSHFWIALPTLSKTLMIIGCVITGIAMVILFIVGVKQKSKEDNPAYFSFQNVLAVSIDRFLSMRSYMIVVQLLSIAILFIILWFFAR